MLQYDISYYLKKYRKPVFWWVFFAVIVIALIAFAYNQQLQEQRRGKLAVPIAIVPGDASVKLDNGQVLPTSGTFYIAPGSYTATISKPGYTTTTQKLRVADYTPPFLYAGLAGESSEAKKWVSDHTYEYSQLELLTKAKSEEYYAQFTAKNPVVKVLPIQDPYFSISYKNVEDRSIELIVTGAAPQYRMFALEELRKKGYEPTDYKIDFKGFENPLGASS